MQQAPMDDQDKFYRLAQILTDDGVRGLEFFRLSEFQNYGRGLSSLLSRQPGEELFRIPQKYIFTDYNIEHHPKLSEIWKAHPKLLSEFESNSQSESGVYPFILHFFYELLYPSSEFNRIWFSMFPRDLEGHSIAWTDLELKACGNLCPIRRDTIEIQVWIEKTYKVLRPIVVEFESSIFGEDGVKQFTKSMVEFLCMTCRNRGVLLPIFAVDIDGDQKNQNQQNQQNENAEEKKESATSSTSISASTESKSKSKGTSSSQQLYHCFVPLGDFGNHKFGAKSSFHLERQNQRRHLNDEMANLFVKSHPNLMEKKFFEFDAASKCLVVRAQEPILSGGQICYEYTAAPNWELLENFGFAVPFNPFDRVIVNITFDAEDPKRMKKELQILSEMGVSSFTKRIPCKRKDGGMEWKYSLSVALTLSDACPQVLLSANRIKLLSSEQLDQLTTQQIAFMDRIIKQHSKKGTLTKDINKLKILEMKIVRSLQQSINVLFEGYKKESLINENTVQRKEVNIVYQSIRTILYKSLQILDQKVLDLATV